MPYDSTRDLTGTVLTLVSLKRLEQARTELETREARFRGTFENAAVGSLMLISRELGCV